MQRASPDPRDHAEASPAATLWHLSYRITFQVKETETLL